MCDYCRSVKNMTNTDTAKCSVIIINHIIRRKIVVVMQRYIRSVPLDVPPPRTVGTTIGPPINSRPGVSLTVLD